MSNDKRGLSATTIAKFVQVSYSTGWLMLNKLRKAMADRNGLYKLGGNVQVDEFFLGGESHGEGRRGKGTKQTNVLIGVSISNGAPTHCFMEVIKDTTAKSPKDVFVRRLDSDTKLISDGNPSYGVCAERPWTSAFDHSIQRRTSTCNIQMAQHPDRELQEIYRRNIPRT
ncbi:unnamed protein product [Acidithrix sp. C25]|nr:unnamed protein product [Acidithrix sp. C25]